MSLLNQTVGWVARNIPGSTWVFRQYQLDFCCVGNQALGDALNARQLDANTILAQLAALQREGSDERCIVFWNICRMI